MKPTLSENMRDTDKVIGATIRGLRKQAGLSQEKLAGVVGVSFQQIQKYEKGTNRVAVSTLIAICHALAVEPMAVIGPVVGAAPAGQSVAMMRLHNRLAAAEERLEAIGALVGGKLPVVSGVDLANLFDVQGFHITQ